MLESEYEKIIMLIIKSLREFLGHSTAELSKLLKLKENYYEQMESGEVAVSAGQAWEIAHTMGFNVVFLFALADAYIKFDFNETPISELEEKRNEIWALCTKEIDSNKEGYYFFKTNLIQIITQIKKYKQ
jgi:transcriptional regulator with XRE-family HTH domain